MIKYLGHILPALLLMIQLAAAESVKVVLFPFREAVIASRVDSTLRPYHFRLGESFKKDSLLTTLDDASYQLKVKQMKAQFDFAKANYTDKKELRAGNFTSDFELKKAEYDFQVAANALAEAELNLTYCQIKAPFAGKIVEIQTREYETVRPGQALFRIIDDNSLLGVMNVSLKDVKQPGTAVTIRLEDGRQIRGSVYEVSPQADHRTGTVRVRILIDNSKGTLRAGMTGELHHVK